VAGMIEFALSEIASALHGRLLGGDARVCRVGSDSRTLPDESLFVALQGERFDGHQFLDLAQQRGARGALISRMIEHPLPRILVDDTRLGLGHLGALWRQRAGTRLIAVTGSNGKTTVKEMLAAILAQCGSVLATRGNLNNDIGLPLTLTRLQDEDFGVVEMGANHPGEIAYLSRLARPQVAILNNAGRAHLEGFDSLEGVARAKGEIIQGLDRDGVLVMNGDDRFAPLWQELAAGHRVVPFGFAAEAEIRSAADSYQLGWEGDTFSSRFEVRTPADRFEVAMPLAGRHNQRNALAAIAAAWVCGIEPVSMQAGLATMQPVAGRLRPLRGCAGMRLVDDSYNANPDSVSAAIEVLRTAPGRKVLVLGDLAELGQERAGLHGEIGSSARAAGIDLLFSCGPLSAAAVERFGRGGRWFADQQQLIDVLLRELSAEDSVLVKGSRSARMDRVVLALSAEGGSC